MTHAEKAVRDAEIVRLRHEGKSMSELAELYGLTGSGIHHICKRYGVGGALSERKADYKKAAETKSKTMVKNDAEVATFVESRNPGFIYVGGYTGCDGFVTVRCKECGNTFERSMVSVKRGCVQCQKCADREREIREAEKKAEAEARAKERHTLAIQHAKERADERESKRHVFYCAECGKAFIAYRPTRKFCCNECAKRSYNRVRKDKRYKAMERDRSITVKALYERDNGVCWLCGKQCDLNDYETREDGTIVCGENYPSVDHIKPVCEGGKDAWNNVRLAHRGCNRIRYQEEHSPLKNVG